MTRSILIGVTVVMAMAAPVVHGEHPAMPAGMTHEQHLAQMRKEADLKTRGDAVMGFDQSVTTHPFSLLADGGLIQVEVNDPADTTTRDLIRRHLMEISEQFAEGNFAKPFLTHNEVPAGVAVMQERKSAIRYQFQAIERGARVRITTVERDALDAVHAFLRYQITEHGTGDPLTVGAR